jgi:hypothetical protein
VPNKWATGAAAFAGIVFILYFFGGWLWSLLKAIVNIIVAIAQVLINFFLAALSIALPALYVIASTLIVVAAIVLAAALVVMLSVALAKSITGKLVELGEQVHQLRVEFKVESRQAAVDGAFLALVATLCSLVAYMATEDFLAQISTVRFVAACGIGLVAAKLFFFFPSRVAKACGIFLTSLILSGSIVFIATHYGFIQDVRTGLTNLQTVFFDPQNAVKVMLVSIIGLLWILTLWFPFTRAGWHRLLATSHPKQ